MSDAPGPASRRSRARELASGSSATQRIGAVAAVLVLATAPFGGWRSASAERTQDLELGQRYDIGAFDVTVEKVSQVPDLAPALSPAEGLRILAVRVTVTNTSGRAELAAQVEEAFSGTGTRAVPWPEQTEPQLRILDVEDANDVPPGEYVNPGVTYEWVLALQQRPDADLDTLELAITGYHFREIDPQTLDPNIWVPDRRPLAEGHVPIVVVE